MWTRVLQLARPRQLIAGMLSLVVCGSVVSLHAGIRGRGKYSGVVIFDRWDTCILLSGLYVMYIADDVKEELRPHMGTAVQVDATEVDQPMNPGDGRIVKYTIVGPAPQRSSNSEINQMRIHVFSDFDPHESPTFTVAITNTGKTPLLHFAKSEVGLTLLGSNMGFPFSPSDGKSVAWVTRAGMFPSKWGAGWTSTIDKSWISPGYSVDPPCVQPDSVVLDPGETLRCRVHFRLPPGEYQFMAGYGGEVFGYRPTASNAISFNVTKEGVAVLQ